MGNTKRKGHPLGARQDVLPKLGGLWPLSLDKTLLLEQAPGPWYFSPGPNTYVLTSMGWAKCSERVSTMFPIEDVSDTNLEEFVWMKLTDLARGVLQSGKGRPSAKWYQNFGVVAHHPDTELPSMYTVMGIDRLLVATPKVAKNSALLFKECYPEHIGQLRIWRQTRSTLSIGMVVYDPPYLLNLV